MSESSKEIEEMSVDVEAILKSLRTGLDQDFLGSQESRANEVTSYTIHRVPQEMRIGADSSQYFVPKVFSIGPVHWGRTELWGGEFQKWKGFHDMFYNNQEFLEKIIKEVSSSVVTEARKCYEQQLLVESLDNLVQIMVLDGFFIIYTFLCHNGNWGHIGPYMDQASQDLLMLENQIPFLVLQCLFDSAYPYLISNPITRYLLYRGLPKDLKVMAQRYLILPRAAVSCGPIPDPVHHLLHLFHSSLRPTSPNSDQNSCWSWFVTGFLATLTSLHIKESAPLRARAVLPRALQSATKLLEAGVKFRKTEDAARSMIDVRFRCGYIEIPWLSVQSSTVSQLLNLLAFEKCKPQCGNHVTAYLAFMNSLIDTAKDVDLLVSSGLLENKLASDDDVAHFFNTAVNNKSVFLKFEEAGHYLTGLLNDLEAYCAKPRHR